MKVDLRLIIANAAFSTALQTEPSIGKGWVEWAQFNDELFASRPTELNLAANAVNCYLNAIGLYKNQRVRKYIARILWLLSLDDESNTIANAFESYKSEIPYDVLFIFSYWYFITFIPQLLAAISRPEGKLMKNILIEIGKNYPQVHIIIIVGSLFLIAYGKGREYTKTKFKAVVRCF